MSLGRTQQQPSASVASSSPSAAYVDPTSTIDPDALRNVDSNHLSLSPWERLATGMSTPFITSASGAVAGIAAGVVTCPLDVIKTKLQAQGGFRAVRHDGAGGGPAAPSVVSYRGLVGTAASIWREEGARGMYRGLFPMILGYFPTWAVYFTVYDRAKEFWLDRLGQDSTGRRKLLAHLLTSVTAGGCSTVLTNPIWVIKTRLMSQASPHASSHSHSRSRSLASSFGNLNDGRAPWHYKSTWDAARKMYTHEGLASFYSGLTPALLGLSHVAVQFPLYEYLKFRFTGMEMGQERNPNDDREGGGGGTSHWVGMSVATVLSKICASTATYPHEVLRTRLQTQQRSLHPPLHSHSSPSPLQSSSSSTITQQQQLDRRKGANGPRMRYHGIIHTIQTILREEGWRAFYVGMGTNMIRAVPAAATTILTYEYVVGRIKTVQFEGMRKRGLLYGGND